MKRKNCLKLLSSTIGLSLSLSLAMGPSAVAYATYDISGLMDDDIPGDYNTDIPMPEEDEEEQRRQQEEQQRQEEEQRRQQEEQQRQEEEQRRQQEEQQRQEEDRRRNTAPAEDDYESAGLYGYNLKVSKEKLSFGTLAKDSPYKSEKLVIKNTSSVGVTLNWTLTDPDSVFRVDSNNVKKIPPKGEATIYINADVSAAGQGTHNGTLLLGDMGDVGFRWGTTVPIAVKVKEDVTPVVRGVELTPDFTTVSPGSVIMYGVEVWGDNDPDQGVTFKVEGAKSRDTKISRDGQLYIGGDESSYTLWVTAASTQDKRVKGRAQVNIEPNKISVTVSAEPSEGGYVTGAGTVDMKGSVRLNASPENGWSFDRWIINGEAVFAGRSYTLTDITRNTTVIARFERDSIRIKVKSDNEDYGTVEGGGYVSPGGKMTIKARPRDGCEFLYWERDGKEYSNEATLTLKDIDKDRQYKAVFRKIKYTVNAVVAPSGAGYIDGVGEYKKGADVTLKANAGSDYVFRAWMRDGKVIGDTTRLTIENISKDQNITAAFEHKQKEVKYFNIEAATTTANGVITPAGITRIPEGGSLTFTITPKAGFGISYVQVDGQNVGAVSSYTFTKVFSNHAIVAAFVPLPETQNQPQNVQPQGPGAPVQSQNVQAPGQPQNVQRQSSQEASQQPSGQAQNHSVQSQVVVNSAEDITHFDETDGNTYKEYIVEDENIHQNTGPSEFMDDLTELSGPLQELNIMPEEALELIRTGQDLELVEAALIDDNISLIVNNSYSANKQETNAGNLGVTDPTIRNFMEVVDSLMTEEEKMRAFSGERISFSLNIVETGEHVDENEKKLLKNNTPSGLKIDDYFNVSFMKIGRGNVANIEELPKELEIRIDVPESMRGRGDFSILREHRGRVDVLPDLDSDPDTITFRTDRFSSYAIASNGTTKVLLFGIIAGVVLLILVVTAIVVSLTGRGRRRRRVRPSH